MDSHELMPPKERHVGVSTADACEEKKRDKLLPLPPIEAKMHKDYQNQPKSGGAGSKTNPKMVKPLKSKKQLS